MPAAANKSTPKTGDPVLRWLAEASRAERATGVPASVLLGLVAVESGGREGLTSSAGAQGLTQFMPGTATQYGVDVRPGHAADQILGAARYLVDLGFHKNPELALASYNAGPAARPSPLEVAGDYPRKVLDAAKRYVGNDNRPVATSSKDASPAARQDDSRLVDGSTALKGLLWVAFVGAGAVLAGLGLGRALGVRNPLGASS